MTGSETVISIGVLGCARIAQRSVIPAILQCDGFRLAAVASRSLAKAAKLAEEFSCRSIHGYDDLLALPGLDAVYVPLPTGLHEEWVEKALRAGLHVLVEKSFTDRMEVAERLVALAVDRERVLMENLMFQYHSQHQRVREWIDEGTIGRLRAFRSSFGFPSLDPADFRYDAALGGGSLIDAGTYTIKAAQLFLGDGLRILASHLRYDPEARVDLHGAAMLAAPDGAVAQVAFGFDNFYQCRYELWGSEGRIVAERAFTPRPDLSPRVVVEDRRGRRALELPPDNHFVAILGEFRRAIATGDFARHGPALIEQARLLDEIRRLAGPRP